jgi:hypothetical protein
MLRFEFHSLQLLGNTTSKDAFFNSLIDKEKAIISVALSSVAPFIDEHAAII